MFIVACLIAGLLIPAAAGAQARETSAVLEYTGGPLRVPFECSNEEMASFGLTCTIAAPCTVFLELTGVDFIDGRLYLAGNLHTDNATLYSVLLASADGGLTWSEPYRRIPGAGLDRVYFIDSAIGWAAGHKLGSQPTDPFFLLTTDGGKIWRQRAVFTDGRPAVIDRFWFDSPRSGGLLIDRLRPTESGAQYEHYETMTGAENWMIREVSATPIRVRRMPGGEPDFDWRVQADTETSSWKVEHRDGGEWIAVTRFQIEVGHCAPVEEQLAEAPPEAPPEAQPSVDKVAPGGVFVIGAPPEFAQPPPEQPEPESSDPKKPKP